MAKYYTFGGLIMKHYEKPTMDTTTVVQLETVAASPWGSFADSLDELGGAITSYLFSSGVETNI